MKRSIKATIIATVVASIVSYSFRSGVRADTAPAAPAAVSVADPTSKHNLNAVYGANIAHDKYGDTQVCLPCHTPHQMPDTTVDHLWNHELKPASSYVLYGTSSSYLTSIDEVSRKCLGCHDGTLAVDSFGSNIVGFSGTNSGLTLTGTMSSDKMGVGTAGYVVGAGGSLTHDHPIDVNYNTAGNYSVTNSGTTSTLTWATTARNNDPSKFTTNGYTSQLWGTKTYTQAAISAVSFYKPAGMNTTVANGTSSSLTTQALYVYCRSCHDPHNHAYNFLRVKNDNSQLCLTCHNK